MFSQTYLGSHCGEANAQCSNARLLVADGWLRRIHGEFARQAVR